MQERLQSSEEEEEEEGDDGLSGKRCGPLYLSNGSLTIGQHWPDVLTTHKDTVEGLYLLCT